MTSVHQRRTGACLDHNRRYLQARTVTDALTDATTALAEAVANGDDRPEVWRLAAARTSQVLAILNVGATALGQPLPAASVALIQELRAWAVTVEARPAADVETMAERPELARPEPGRREPGPGLPARPAKGISERPAGDNGLLPRATPAGRAPRAVTAAPAATVALVATVAPAPRAVTAAPAASAATVVMGAPAPSAELPRRAGGLGGKPPEPTVQLTDDQRVALIKLGRAGGRQTRETLGLRMLLELLSARLVAPFGDEQIQITTHGLRSLAAALRGAP